MNKTNIKRYLAEATMIIFSVLFALFINRCSENSNLENQKEEALNSILLELKGNSKNLDNWIENHKGIQVTLNNLVAGKADSLKQLLKNESYLNLGLLNENESLINSFLLNASWQTSKNTGIIAEFDFNTSQGLTQTYTLQEIITNQTIKGILDLYFDKESQDLDNLDQTLMQMNLRFHELVGQEFLLNQYYESSIKELEKGT